MTELAELMFIVVTFSLILSHGNTELLDGDGLSFIVGFQMAFLDSAEKDCTWCPMLFFSYFCATSVVFAWNVRKVRLGEKS